LEKLLIYYEGDHLLIKGDYQNWEDGISTENKLVESPEMHHKSNNGHEYNFVRDT